MDDPWGARLVEAVLRCYPARWRRRHGEEAAELAALLIGDGTPAVSIAGSYLAGAAREWLTPRPGRRLTAVACALLVAACSVAVSAGLLASAAPARAASTAQAHRSSASQVRGPAHCRPGSPGPVPGLTPATGLTPAMSRLQLIIWAAGHGRSC
ncbi:MAG TPA: hypothetical protein VGG50_02540 [Streptosporangiaceae bacterium]|jgi:hypothetical protein